MGWHRKLLRVKLGAGSCVSEPLNMAWAEAYLGQRGLATKYLTEEIDPAVDALSPDNKLITTTGPLTGTMARTGGHRSVQGMRDTGERTWNLERQFNLRAGLTARDNTLPKRLLEEPAASGTAKGLVAKLPQMLPEYYELRGWSAEGIPAQATLARLGLASA